MAGAAARPAAETRTGSRSSEDVLDRPLPCQRLDLARQARRRGDAHRVRGLQGRLELAGPHEPDRDGCRAGWRRSRSWSRASMFSSAYARLTRIASSRARRSRMPSSGVISWIVSSSAPPDSRTIGRGQHGQVVPDPALDLLVEAREDGDAGSTRSCPRATAFSIVLPSFIALLDLLLLEAARGRRRSGPTARPAGEVGDPRLGESLDLVGETGQRMARDVEAQRVLLALELLVQRPLRQTPGSRRASSRPRRSAAPPPNRFDWPSSISSRRRAALGERAFRRAGQGRPVPPERIEGARRDESVERALVDEARVQPLDEIGERAERPLAALLQDRAAPPPRRRP